MLIGSLDGTWDDTSLAWMPPAQQFTSFTAICILKYQFLTILSWSAAMEEPDICCSRPGQAGAGWAELEVERDRACSCCWLGLATADTGPDTDWDWDTPPLDKHSQTNIAGPSTALALYLSCCLRSRPVDPNVVVRQSIIVRSNVEMTWWDDRMTLMTGWTVDRMTGWQHHRISGWHNRMDDQMSRWPDDRKLHRRLTVCYIKYYLSTIYTKRCNQTAHIQAETLINTNIYIRFSILYHQLHYSLKAEVEISWQ